MPLNRCSVIVLLLLQQLTGFAQQQTKADQFAGLPATFFSRFSNKVDQKIDNLDQQLTRQTERYLKKLAKQERRLQKKIFKIDSTAAKSFGDINAQYAALTEKIKSPSLNNTSLSGQYLPNIDSLETGLSFLNQNSQLLSSSKQLTGKLQHSLGGLQQLQGKLQTTEQVKQFIRQIVQCLKLK